MHEVSLDRLATFRLWNGLYEEGVQFTFSSFDNFVDARITSILEFSSSLVSFRQFSRVLAPRFCSIFVLQWFSNKSFSLGFLATLRQWHGLHVPDALLSASFDSFRSINHNLPTFSSHYFPWFHPTFKDSNHPRLKGSSSIIDRRTFLTVIA